jgi:hypothetical protein
MSGNKNVDINIDRSASLLSTPGKCQRTAKGMWNVFAR